ncbi:MAG: hypothetical protein HYX90_10600 [Chloroflexi bacterium]|nr:hypothetical protein [Chloroflexota bacterium]
MNRKVKFLVLPLAGLALLVGSAVPVLGKALDQRTNTTSAQAQGPKDGVQPLARARQHVVKGTVDSVTGTTIKLKSGQTVLVDDKTKYLVPGKQDASLADVVPGSNIIAQVIRTEAGALALRVHVTPDRPAPVTHSGTVTAYEEGAGITIKTLKGDTVSFIIDSETKIRLPKEAGPIEVGDLVTIVAIKDKSSDTLVARVISVQRARLIEGSVMSIAADSITVKTSSGEVTVATGEDTVYVVKGAPAVAPGDSVRIAAVIQADGSLLAKVVLDGAKLPGIMERFGPGAHGKPALPGHKRVPARDGKTA